MNLMLVDCGILHTYIHYLLYYTTNPPLPPIIHLSIPNSSLHPTIPPAAGKSITSELTWARSGFQIGPRAKMEWLTPLQTAGAYLIAATRLLALMVYYVTIPLHYPIYYTYALVAFLLSPFRFVFHTFLGLASFVVGLVARLKYLYLYFACAAFIGICAGCMLHGTSSFIFVLLGVDSATQQQQQRLRAAAERRQQQQQQQLSRLPPLDEADEEGEEEDDDEDEGQQDEFGDSNSNFSGDSSTRQYSSSLSSSRAGKQPSSSSLLSRSRWGIGGGWSRRKADSRLDDDPLASEMFEDRWKLLRSTEKPRRRRRGLLSQTIHEESSESDFT
ncbi:hypothetical protein F5X96DRAFT_642478 [Biscogniauxia mediterranea]|nr:hypothetical protein F5X96DRAFT_642478 [Biscogniauxia mediterranea]